MSKNWIAGAIKHPGAFTAKAKDHHMGVQAYANKVLGSSNASSTTKRQASLAKTLSKFHHHHKA
jgi:hypothetical protein